MDLFAPSFGNRWFSLAANLLTLYALYCLAVKFLDLPAIAGGCGCSGERGGSAPDLTTMAGKRAAAAAAAGNCP